MAPLSTPLVCSSGCCCRARCGWSDCAAVAHETREGSRFEGACCPLPCCSCNLCSSCSISLDSNAGGAAAAELVLRAGMPPFADVAVLEGPDSGGREPSATSFTCCCWTAGGDRGAVISARLGGCNTPGGRFRCCDADVAAEDARGACGSDCSGGGCRSMASGDAPIGGRLPGGNPHSVRSASWRTYCNRCAMLKSCLICLSRGSPAYALVRALMTGACFVWLIG